MDPPSSDRLREPLKTRKVMENIEMNDKNSNANGVSPHLIHEGVRPHDFHGKIGADGSFFDMRGNYIDNLNYHR